MSGAGSLTDIPLSLGEGINSIADYLIDQADQGSSDLSDAINNLHNQARDLRDLENECCS